MTTILTDVLARKAHDAFIANFPAPLPWEPQLEAVLPVYMAGWEAGRASAGVPAGLFTPPPKYVLDTSVLLAAVKAKLDFDAACSIEPLPLQDDLPATTPEQIYQAYPRHVGKQAAIKAIKKAFALKGATSLLRNTLDYKAATDLWPKDERKFIPHPASWFNAGCYDDDQKEWQRGYRAVTSSFSKPAH